MLIFLQRYLRIKTAYPEPDYDAVINLFKEQARQDCLALQIILLLSGNPVMIMINN